MAGVSIRICGRDISNEDVPYVVAEMSANHNGRIETAYRMIDAAKEAGADAVKIQTYTPDTITLKSDADAFRIHGGLWDGRLLYDLYAQVPTPGNGTSRSSRMWCKVSYHDLQFPVRQTAVDLLEDLNAPAYKIASFEAVDLPLIKYVAGTPNPTISTGMADSDEIGEAVAVARDGGCKELALLRCVSSYPAPAADYNLRTLADMRARFGTVVGLSDHTLDNTTAIASVALGAADHRKALHLYWTGDEFFIVARRIVCAMPRRPHGLVRTVFGDYGRKSSELGNVKFRRSLYFVKALAAGEPVTADAVRSVRPGYGLAPKHLDSVIGRRVARAVDANTPVAWECFEQ